MLICNNINGLETIELISIFPLMGKVSSIKLTMDDISFIKIFITKVGNVFKLDGILWLLFIIWVSLRDILKNNGI